MDTCVSVCILRCWNFTPCLFVAAFVSCYTICTLYVKIIGIIQIILFLLFTNYLKLFMLHSPLCARTDACMHVRICFLYAVGLENVSVPYELPTFRLSVIPYYFDLRHTYFHMFPNWKLGCALNSRYYFSLFEILETSIFFKEKVALLKEYRIFSNLIRTLFTVLEG
jgi:hypothetical protein